MQEYELKYGCNPNQKPARKVLYNNTRRYRKNRKIIKARFMG